MVLILKEHIMEWREKGREFQEVKFGWAPKKLKYKKEGQEIQVEVGI
jgi:hypothetical protein